MSEDKPPNPSTGDAVGKQARENRPLTTAAERALAEAAARRADRDRDAADRPKEINGRGGLEPTRYGDWEINGLTPDF